MNRKGLIAKIGSVAAAAALSITVFAACGSESSAKAAGFVTLDINPSIELTIDKNDRVTSVYAVNRDAEILLVDMDLEGKKIEDAAEAIAKTAEKMGYINENNTDATVIAVAEDGSGAEIADKVESGLSEGSAKIISVHKESTNSLEREVRQLKESDPALYQNLTPALLRMIRTAQKYDSSITLETGLTMSVGELSRLIHDAHKDYKDLLTEGLQDEYERIYEERAAVIREKIDEVYGEEYAALKKTERALDDILDRIEDELENAEIALEDAEKIARLLGLDGVEKLRDGGGKITAESVDEVADKIEDAFDGDDEAEEAFEEKLDEVENILERYEFDEDDYVLSAEEAAEISEITGREFARYEDAEEYLDELEDDLDDMKDCISLTKEQKNEIKSLERELKELKKEVKNQLKDDISAVKEELKELKKHKQNG